MTDALDRRQLNRALLARQLLLGRRAMSTLDAVEHLVGLQAQLPTPPYYGLWTRVEGFRPDDLARLLLDRTVVRMTLLRGTIHLVSSRDCLLLRPLLQPLHDRFVSAFLPVDGPGPDELGPAARALLEERPRTPKELREAIGQRWPRHDAQALAMAARSLLPVVHLPPRGVWGRTGQTTLTTAESWLGRPLRRRPSPAAMVRRYLAAFGPASVDDMQTWSGLTRLREVVEPIRGELRTFRAPSGAELFDLPAAPRPDPDTPAPVRFLPEYDNCLRSHADRERVIPASARPWLASKNDAPRPTVLVGGEVRAGWRLVRRRGAVTLEVRAYHRLSKKDTAAVVVEGGRLLEFAAPEVPARDVRIEPVPA